MSEDPFVKLYASLLESTLWWNEDLPTRLVWITLLLAADHNGVYRGTLPGLAGKARVSLDEARHAIWRLQQPDNESRTPDNDGRRLEVVTGTGYRLLNYKTYRDKRSPKQVADAAHKAAQRERDKCDMSGVSGEVSRVSLLESGSDPDPDPDPDARELPPPKVTEPPRDTRRPGLFEFREGWKPKESHRDYGRSIGLTEAEMLERAEHCRLKMYEHPFPSEDKQFRRELLWLRNDKETKRFREQRKANPNGFNENPGAGRRPDDPRPAPIFGRRGVG